LRVVIKEDEVALQAKAWTRTTPAVWVQACASRR